MGLKEFYIVIIVILAPSYFHYCCGIKQLEIGFSMIIESQFLTWIIESSHAIEC